MNETEKQVQSELDWSDSNQVVGACVITENAAAVAVGLMVLGVIKIGETIAKATRHILRKIDEHRNRMEVDDFEEY